MTGATFHTLTALLLAGFLAPAACSGAADEGPGGGGGTGGTGGGGSGLDAGSISVGCYTCVASACGDELNACAERADCSPIMGCALGCADAPDCIEECLEENPGGRAIWESMYACVRQNCAICIARDAAPGDV
jgi:hypothetical protein